MVTLDSVLLQCMGSRRHALAGMCNKKLTSSTHDCTHGCHLKNIKFPNKDAIVLKCITISCLRKAYPKIKEIIIVIKEIIDYSNVNEIIHFLCPLPQCNKSIISELIA